MPFILPGLSGLPLQLHNKVFKFNSMWRENKELLYTKQNTDRMLKFDWLRAGPYACVRTGIWTGWTSVHNNKGEQTDFLQFYLCGYTIKLLLTLSLVHTENICCDVMLHGPHFIRSVRHDVTTNIFANGPHSRLIRAYSFSNIFHTENNGHAFIEPPFVFVYKACDSTQ